ncbi:DEAD/DEAH box helicase [Cytobacillus sp. FJAT-54145]|uniref:DEAD/DEAH box helicase n=1 Tax=Cytobacillus spartinae TaxID=3299023 RepID=A0ABW6KBZ2_9BACI
MNLLETPIPPLSSNLDLQKITIGKQLLLEDFPFSIVELQNYCETGLLTYCPGILTEKNNPKCARCGNRDKQWFASYPCSRCGEICLYCRKCIMMGRISSCTKLYTWSGPPFTLETTPKLSWSGTLSPGQKVASERVVTAVKENKDLLVWAVCGAGKTEVLFEGIHTALSAKKRVCIATPRTDVVLELTPRLQAVFPDIHVASLYGGSEDRHTYSPLTISTTHQLLRFYKAFDTIILDEVDAFPYSVDEMLQYAVSQARKEVSSMIYLTATPNEKWQRECRTGKREFVTIPARYHRHPLPVPKFEWCGNWQKLLKKNKLPPNVMKWLISRLQSNKQSLLFVPQISLMEKILPILQVVNPNIVGVHAEDPDRKEKVQAMRRKEVPMLVTTTILERGVTFPNIDVAVLGAEDRIFTESALVQIAGRVGRSADHPTGHITFFHYGRTEAMVKARNQIVNMNKEAMKKGLVDA